MAWPDRHQIKIALDTLKLSESGAVCMGTSHRAAIRTLLAARVSRREIVRKLASAGWKPGEIGQMIDSAYQQTEWR